MRWSNAGWDARSRRDHPRAERWPSSSALSAAASSSARPWSAAKRSATNSARRLIADLEPIARDRYGGPVGWLGADGDGE